MSKTLLSGGCVLTLGGKTPNFTRADVLIDGETITEIDTGLRARDAELVDATDTIVMPGFVDTHRHAWRSLSRNVGAGPPDGGTTGRSDAFRPEDIYAATLIGLLGAIEAGISTAVDWSSIPSDDALADAALQAHADAGLRTVFVHAPRPGTDDRRSTAPAIRQLVARLTDAAGPLTTIAFGTEIPGENDLARVELEWMVARELGLRIHAHVDAETSGPGAIAALARRGLLGRDVTLVHCSLDDEDVGAIAASGASVSLAPSGEMADHITTPPIQALIDGDIRPGLGVDEERLTPGDLFAQMRATISMQHATVFDRKLAGKAGVPRLMSTRDVIRHATVDGARAVGLGGATGSLEPGKQADIVMLRTDRPNIFPINDPIGAVVWGMDTSNVDRVFVSGRVLMRGGVLVADVARARKLATVARRHLIESSGAVPGTMSAGSP